MMITFTSSIIVKIQSNVMENLSVYKYGGPPTRLHLYCGHSNEDRAYQVILFGFIPFGKYVDLIVFCSEISLVGKCKYFRGRYI